MLGTLNGALEAREVRLGAGALEATVTGFNEIVDRLPVLTRIEIEYRLRIPTNARDVVDWALVSLPKLLDALQQPHDIVSGKATTLKGAVEVVWTAKIVEEAET